MARKRRARLFNLPDIISRERTEWGHLLINITVRDGSMAFGSNMVRAPHMKRDELAHRRAVALESIWKMLCDHHGQNPRAPRQFGPRY